MLTSFSAGAKEEICRTMPSKSCCVLAECFGILLFCNSFTTEGVRIITESRDFAQFLPKIFKRAFDIDFDTLPDPNAGNKLIFQIRQPDKMSTILNSYGFTPDQTLALHLNLAVVEEDCCKASFLRGAFLAGGSVTDPEKGYHFEMTTTHQSVAKECLSLLQDLLGFTPKMASRNGNQVIYFKQSDLISDYLTFIGAPLAAMGIMEAKLEKELKNKVNRRCNCDDANISKVVDAAQEQLAAIRILRDKGIFEHLPQKLQQAALAREQNPASSLMDLAAMMEPPISKPAMNHRLKKLQIMAKEAEL